MRQYHASIRLKGVSFDLLTIPTVDSVTPYRRQVDGLLVWRKQLVEAVRVPAETAIAPKAGPAQLTTILVVVASFGASHTQRGHGRLARDDKTSTTDPKGCAHTSKVVCEVLHAAAETW